MKVIQAKAVTQSTITKNLNELIAAFDSFAVVALTGLGRNFDSDNKLYNLYQEKDHYTKTETYAVITNDSIHGMWIPHPDEKIGIWDQQYIDGLKALISSTKFKVVDNFIPTPQETT